MRVNTIKAALLDLGVPVADIANAYLHADCCKSVKNVKISSRRNCKHYQCVTGFFSLVGVKISDLVYFDGVGCCGWK